jgi:hypothetical protein
MGVTQAVCDLKNPVVPARAAKIAPVPDACHFGTDGSVKTT